MKLENRLDWTDSRLLAGAVVVVVVGGSPRLRPNQFVQVLLSDSSHLTAAYQQILRHNHQDCA